MGRPTRRHYSRPVSFRSSSLPIRNKGLNFIIDDTHEHPVPGCRITATLYEPLSRAQLLSVTRDVKLHTRYSPVTIRIDGERVTTHPAEVEWSTETDSFWFNENSNSTAGVAVYNLGIYVCHYSHHRLGVSGTLVSKPGHGFMLNTARNEVLKVKCTDWQEAIKLIAKETHERRAKKRFTDTDRASIISEMLRGDTQPWDHYRTQLPKTITGRHTSFAQIVKNTRGPFTVARSANSQTGEQVHAQRMATVLSPHALTWFEVDNATQMAAHLNTWFPLRSGRFNARDFDELAKNFDDDAILIPLDKLPPKERAAHAGLVQLSTDIHSEIRTIALPDAMRPTRHPRQVHVGRWDLANAWTDGLFIAIDQRFLARQLSRGFSGWLTLSLTMIHEFLHYTDTRSAHVHDHEFYETFHNLVTANDYAGFRDRDARLQQLPRQTQATRRKAHRRNGKNPRSTRVDRPKRVSHRRLTHRPNVGSRSVRTVPLTLHVLAETRCKLSDNLGVLPRLRPSTIRPHQDRRATHTIRRNEPRVERNPTFARTNIKGDAIFKEPHNVHTRYLNGKPRPWSRIIGQATHQLRRHRRLPP